MNNTNSDAHITISNLNLWYQGNQVLKGIDVKIPRNKVTAIIGPSGCGKTTLLKCVNRMIELVPGTRLEGKVMIDGLDVYGRGVDVTMIRKRIGLISQKPVLLPMSIFDNVAYGARIYGTGGRKKLRETVERCLKTAGLWDEVKDRLKEPATRLSIGQQQRLCLARGLAVEPEVLLFDEPTSALDPVSSMKIEQEIVDLKENYTCLIVTHNLQQAVRIADNVLFVYAGELVEHGAACDVLQSPKQASTQEFIGRGGS
ncbi:MAG TPA: phosphate ABC transporter ATP-binding protein [Armatimonadota bacterium]|jgi:phosphate transport system ATP-binding protein